MIDVNLVDVDCENSQIEEEMRCVVDDERNVFVGLLNYFIKVYGRPQA